MSLLQRRKSVIRVLLASCRLGGGRRAITSKRIALIAGIKASRVIGAREGGRKPWGPVTGSQFIKLKPYHVYRLIYLISYDI